MSYYQDIEAVIRDALTRAEAHRGPLVDVIARIAEDCGQPLRIGADGETLIEIRDLVDRTGTVVPTAVSDGRALIPTGDERLDPASDRLVRPISPLEAFVLASKMLRGIALGPRPSTLQLATHAA